MSDPADTPDVLSPGQFGLAFQAFLEASLRLAPTETPELIRRLREHFGTEADPALPVLTRDFGRPDHPNLQLALDDLLGREDWTSDIIGLRGLDGHQGVGLSDLMSLQAVHYGPTPRPGPLRYASVALGSGETINCVANALLLLEHDGRPLAVLVVASRDRMMGGSPLRLEAVAARPEDAEAFLTELTALMREHNVYRGHVVAFVGSEEGGVELEFRTLPEVPREAIVLPDGVLERVERHALAPIRQRDRLLAAGRHLKRGLLLHGPPGTGKTLTAMHLVGRTPGRTTIILSGRSFGVLEPACALARDLQPATVILEDVDLVAQERFHYDGSEPLLFELLNQMDGMAEDADVLFVLTTNRADVLEPALAARPGRIDQAVELPLPDPAGLERLLERYAAGLTVRYQRRAELVERLEGASPAHVKELLRKAALIAAEEETSGPLVVEDRHLFAALEDLVIGTGELRAAHNDPDVAEEAFDFPPD